MILLCRSLTRSWYDSFVSSEQIQNCLNSSINSFSCKISDLAWNYSGLHYCLFVKVLFGNLLELPKRRRRDLNPRAAINDLHPFQGCPFSLLGTSANYKKYASSASILLYIGLRSILRGASTPAERVGFEPTRPSGQTVFKTASLWPLRYLSECVVSAQRVIWYHNFILLSSPFQKFKQMFSTNIIIFPIYKFKLI